MSKKKIIIYVPNLSGGGTERFYTQLSKFLSNLQKYSITYFYSINSSNTIPINNQYIEFKKTISSKSIVSLLEIIIFTWRYKYGLILTAQNHPNVLFSFFRFLLPYRTKLIISERAFTDLALADSKRISNKLINKLIPFSYRNADYVHCLTKRIASHIVSKYKVPIKKIAVIPNFVDVLSIDKNSYKKINLDEDKKNFLNSPYIVSIGRLHNQKGYKFLINAYSNISNLVPHNLVILGEGPLLSNLKNQVKKLNLEKRVLFCGFITNPYPILRKSELFVLSSLYEGMPNVLLEAIALGVPIVSSDCPSGPREILGDKYKKLLYYPNDTKSLSKLMIKQIKKPTKIPINYLNKSFSIEKVLTAHDDLISKCL